MMDPAEKAREARMRLGTLRPACHSCAEHNLPGNSNVTLEDATPLHLIFRCARCRGVWREVLNVPGNYVAEWAP